MPVPLERLYAPEEFDRLKQGSVPEQMEDKWFIFYEEPWLHLHRSWTGFCIYQVRLEATADGDRMAEALVNRDPEQYRETDLMADAMLLAVLLDGLAGRDTSAGWEQYLARLKQN
jgi:hypothetical protein